jgi:hypothetical protein
MPGNPHRDPTFKTADIIMTFLMMMASAYGCIDSLFVAFKDLTPWQIAVPGFFLALLLALTASFAVQLDDKR